MKVFNLTRKALHFHGRLLFPDGGYAEYPDDTFFPDRDLKLQDEGLIAIGQIPDWYIQQKQIEAEKRSTVAPEPLPVAVVEEAKVEPQEISKKRK